MFIAVIKHATSNVRATVRIPSCARTEASKSLSPQLRLLHSSISAAGLPRPEMTFLHHSRNAVINWIEVLALGRPHVRSIEFRSFTTTLLHCLTCPTSRCIVLLKDVNFIIDASDGTTLLHTQQLLLLLPPPPPPPPLPLLLHSYTLLLLLLFWRSLQVRPNSPKDAQRRTPGDCWCKYFTGQIDAVPFTQPAVSKH